MARVSEGSTIHAINFSIGKTKEKLENLQLKGSNLKQVQKPSDNPIGNMEILSIRSKDIDGNQYLRNGSVAKAQLTYTENAIEDLTNLMVKAKELAISQSSNIFDTSVRTSIAREVGQLYNQALGIGNRRIGNKYIFAGHKSLTKPFTVNGEYLGDGNQTRIEVAKDTFVPVTFNGRDVFFDKTGSPVPERSPLDNSPFENLSNQFELQRPEPHFKENEPPQINRELASSEEPSLPDFARGSIFSDLKRFENALVTNNHEIIQDLLPSFDESIERLVEIRTVIGSTINKIDTATNAVEHNMLTNAEYKSKIEDADVAELFTDLTRQQNVLNATYKASAQMMNNNLMNYIK